MNLDSIIQNCNYLLRESPDAEDTYKYVKDRVSDDSINAFMFGYFPASSKLTLLSSLVGEDSLKESKLLYSKEFSENNSRHNYFSFFENYPMVMPYRDVYGNIIAIVGRSTLSENERKIKKISKYKNTVFNKSNHLFGLYESKHHIISSGFAYVVEGQFDVIKAHEKGIKNIVAIGSSNMSFYQASLVSRYTDTIFLLLDNDEAGKRGRDKIINNYKNIINIQNIYLPEGYKDIDEYLSVNDGETLNFLA